MDPDRELVDRTVAGDLTAFETLVERHRDVVYRVAARTVGPAEAEDVSQDASFAPSTGFGDFAETHRFARGYSESHTTRR